MPPMNHDVQNGKNLTTLLSEMKEELQEFVQTRIAMLKTELREKLDILKTAAPLGAGAVLLLTTAYFLFTFALVGLIVAALPDNRYRWFIAFLSIAVLWSLLGGLAAYLAKRELEVKGLTPKRTIEVLKGDKMWVQSEVKNQI
jgi:uncharacterized membrane protein YqjE